CAPEKTTPGDCSPSLRVESSRRSSGTVCGCWGRGGGGGVAQRNIAAPETSRTPGARGICLNSPARGLSGFRRFHADTEGGVDYPPTARGFVRHYLPDL